MSNQSKSMVLPFIIFAGIVFAGAAVWKFTRDSKPEQTPQKQTSQTQPAPVKSKPKVTIKSYDKPVETKPVTPLTQEERAQRRNKAKNYMKFAMRYDSKDKALEALKQAVDASQTEKAELLIEFINDHYPNTEIPSELLDF